MIAKLTFLSLTVSFFALSSAHAEYRVYQYLVKPKNMAAMVTQVQAKPVRSTLNPVAFLSYNGGKSAVDITLMRSWMCPGSTARKEYCIHPSERLAYE